MEWEFAVHGGNSSVPYYGSDIELLDAFEWTERNSKDTSHPVGNLRPNEHGLFDMLGNCGEWTDSVVKRLELPRDSFVHEFDPDGLGRFPSSREKMTTRGGRYNFSSSSARAAERNYYPPDYESVTIGFRVARTVKD